MNLAQKVSAPWRTAQPLGTVGSVWFPLLAALPAPLASRAFFNSASNCSFFCFSLLRLAAALLGFPSPPGGVTVALAVAIFAELAEPAGKGVMQIWTVGSYTRLFMAMSKGLLPSGFGRKAPLVSWLSSCHSSLSADNASSRNDGQRRFLSQGPEQQRGPLFACRVGHKSTSVERQRSTLERFAQGQLSKE